MRSMLNRLAPLGRCLPALAVAGLLAACTVAPVLTPLAVTVPRLDSAIGRPCDAPADLPDTATANEVRRLWARDRAALANCSDRQRAAVGLYDGVTHALAPAP